MTILRKKKKCLQCKKDRYIFSHGRCEGCARAVSIVLKKAQIRELPVKKIGRGKAYDEIYLWDIFSLFIRFRDTDKNGNGQCFTCKLPRHYTKLDCGHGAGRQHKGTKYNEKNNHAQCKRCNGFEEGRKDLYKIEVNKLYGPNTWDLMQAASRQVTKITKFEYDLLTDLYYKQVIKMAEEKGIDPVTLKPIQRWVSRTNTKK